MFGRADICIFHVNICHDRIFKSLIAITKVIKKAVSDKQFALISAYLSFI